MNQTINRNNFQEDLNMLLKNVMIKKIINYLLQHVKDSCLLYINCWNEM